MALFRKNPTAPGPHPITAFWAWWAESGRKIDPYRASNETDELSLRVQAIHPDLTWHFAKGATSQHRLIVSAGGVAAVRPSAERWLRAAPQSDDVWEYRATQEADADALSNTLQIAGYKFDLKSTAFRVEPVDEELRVHVGVYHPEFLVAPEAVRGQVTYLLLDWLLGEDDVERWLGHIEPLTAPPDQLSSAADLIAAVAELAGKRDPNAWVLARGQDKQGTAFLATFRRGLRWIDTPTLDRHQIITAKYRAQANGLPVDAEALHALREVESRLESVLGARGILVAYETGRGARRFHAYTDGEDQNIDAAIDKWANEQGLSLESQPDPAWSQVRHYTG